MAGTSGLAVLAARPGPARTGTAGRYGSRSPASRAAQRNGLFQRAPRPGRRRPGRRGRSDPVSPAGARARRGPRRPHRRHPRCPARRRRPGQPQAHHRRAGPPDRRVHPPGPARLARLLAHPVAGHRQPAPAHQPALGDGHRAGQHRSTTPRPNSAARPRPWNGCASTGNSRKPAPTAPTRCAWRRCSTWTPRPPSATPRAPACSFPPGPRSKIPPVPANPRARIIHRA